jgi:hypothetical protein
MYNSRMLSVVLLAVRGLPVFAAFNFSPYPACVQTYLYADAPSQCDYGNTSDDLTKQENICLCSNSAFLTTVSQQIFQNCGCEDLTATANMAVGICEAYQVMPLYSAQQLITMGDGGTYPCVAQVSGSQSTTPSPNPTTSLSGTATSSQTASGVVTSESATRSTPPTTMATSTSTTSSSSGATPSTDLSASSNSEQVGLAKESNRIALGCGLGGIGAMIVVGVLGYVFRERIRDVVRGLSTRRGGYGAARQRIF